MDLKLKRLPDRTPVKLTVSIPPALDSALRDYAGLYREAYGEAVAVQELVPAMLEAFLQGDRTFSKRRKGAKGDEQAG